MSRNEILTTALSVTIEVLAEAGETQWRRSFVSLKTQIEHGCDKDTQTVARQILSMSTGGMGSFNDLMLIKNGKPDVVLNERLNLTRKRLYESALAVIPGLYR